MRTLAILCFFFSGASGLVFQVIWSRLFSLVFGTTTLALSTVLTAFMAGLALGSYLAGRYADRIKKPIKLYAYAEFGIGAFAFILPLIALRFSSLNAWAYQHFADNYLILSAIRFSASFILIIFPTTLMGATLPILSRYFISNPTEHARVGIRIGSLYAINTAGAVLGTLSGGFIFLPKFGLQATNAIAASINIFLSITVLIAYRYNESKKHLKPSDDDLEQLVEEMRTPQIQALPIQQSAKRLALWAFAFSGASAMVYEVIWSRALAINIGSSVYSFTLVLSIFLIGLALGAALIGKLSARCSDPIAWLSLNHLAIAFFVIVSYFIIHKLPWIYLYLLRDEIISADTVMARQFMLIAIVMLPSTIAMGGIFPLTIRTLSSDIKWVGKDVGNAYSINTIGAIIGSFLAGFVVIPILEMQAGIYAALMVNIVLAALFAAYTYWRKTLKYTVAIIATLVIALGPLVPHWNRYELSVGFFRPTVARDAIQKHGSWKRPRLVFYRDGLSTTVSVEQWSAKHFSLKNNGKVDASTGDDMPTQITVGLLPILLHPKTPTLSPDVLLIGYASGVTAGAALQYPRAKLDVVELEPAVIEASHYFDHVNQKPLTNKRLRLITDDGRNFLSATAKRYDVIINEPSNPWITGVSNLFTEDYFRIAQKKLKPGGVFCTWTQVYELAPRRVKSIYKAFSRVFPYVYAFSATSLSSDTFIIGADTKLNLDVPRLQRLFKIPSIKAEMKRALIESPFDLIALTLLTPPEVNAFTIGAQVNTDNNALVEFAAPLDLYNHKRYDYFVSKLYSYHWPYGDLNNFVRGLKTSDEYASLIRGLLRQGRLRQSLHYLSFVDPLKSPLSHKIHTLIRLIDPTEEEDREFPLYDATDPLTPPHVGNPNRKNQISTDYRKILNSFRRGSHKEAIDIIEKWSDEERENAGDDFHYLWGYLVYRSGEYRIASNIFKPLLKKKKFVSRRPVFYFYLAKSFWADANFAKAVDAFEIWIKYRQSKGLPAVPLFTPLNKQNATDS